MRGLVPWLALVSLFTLGNANAGTIVGSVTVDGSLQPLPSMAVTVDQETCGQGSVSDPSLVVAAERTLANAVVLVQGVPGGEWKASEWRLQERGCRFEPHVIVIPAGKKLTVANEDGILHDLHVMSKENAASNVPHPSSLRLMERTWDKPEAFRIECDVHPWESAFIVVIDNPYYAITGLDGSFTLDGLPDGAYTLVVLHERLGRVEKSVKLKGRRPVTVDVAMPLPSTP